MTEFDAVFVFYFLLFAFQKCPVSYFLKNILLYGLPGGYLSFLGPVENAANCRVPRTDFPAITCNNWSVWKCWSGKLECCSVQSQVKILKCSFSWFLNRVSFTVRPTILNSGSHPSEVVVTQGNAVSLECKAQGFPEPGITWMKDGQTLVGGGDIAILHDGHLLQLQNAQVSDTGRYVCVAANVAGLSDRKYDLNVHGR